MSSRRSGAIEKSYQKQRFPCRLIGIEMTKLNFSEVSLVIKNQLTYIKFPE